MILFLYINSRRPGRTSHEPPARARDFKSQLFVTDFYEKSLKKSLIFQKTTFCHWLSKNFFRHFPVPGFQQPRPRALVLASFTINIMYHGSLWLQPPASSWIFCSFSWFKPKLFTKYFGSAWLFHKAFWLGSCWNFYGSVHLYTCIIFYTYFQSSGFALVLAIAVLTVSELGTRKFWRFKKSDISKKESTNEYKKNSWNPLMFSTDFPGFRIFLSLSNPIKNGRFENCKQTLEDLKPSTLFKSDDF